ncbi:alginate export family protein [Candidatus Nitronereus thalassa]|uniref:Alginate export family protein n=1 Tax=Candidatus Nitronereus thalassa TaxID=3020898 RepID=A0ABU3KAR5_9BACT|nr:alginate export family protein [Candidatus Nitronereus thalassa]MDT7043408.1 alginate export family protein [Candidatus Nitronereus thalassa]
MKGFSNGLKWTTAAVLFVSMTAAPAFAAKTTPATDKKTDVPAVPRAIPDLIPYHKFDPPTSKMFDINNLNITGDIRVRPEFRNNTAFGTGGSIAVGANPSSTSQNNDFFVQQWVRLGFHYTISPDVVFFFQPQYSKNWGDASPAAGAGDPNASNGEGNDIFARQAFMLIRNFGVKNLTAKIGRQLVVWGNHRMFGHFDWNNVGWAFDGASLHYTVNPNISVETAWLRVREGECAGSGAGSCTGSAVTTGGGVPTGSGTAGDANIIFVRAPMKFAGVVLEPTWIWHDSGTGGALSGARPSNQSRHTIGGRVTTTQAISKVRVDVTGEGYYQFGEIGAPGLARLQDIEAYALHFDGGITLPVPMQPRIGGEFNIASGSSDANSCSTGTGTVANGGCNSDWRGFDQLFPTNHIHFGYMDRMAWKNMIHFAAGLQLRPTADSHLEITGHKFYLNETNDNWYQATQTVYITSPAGNQEDDLGSEIDVVYTMFFTPGNHVAWQIGGGVFFPGDFIDDNPQSGFNNVGVGNESWGYTQLWINW